MPWEGDGRHNTWLAGDCTSTPCSGTNSYQWGAIFWPGPLSKFISRSVPQRCDYIGSVLSCQLSIKHLVGEWRPAMTPLQRGRKSGPDVAVSPLGLCGSNTQLQTVSCSLPILLRSSLRLVWRRPESCSGPLPFSCTSHYLSSTQWPG